MFKYSKKRRCQGSIKRFNDPFVKFSLELDIRNKFKSGYKNTKGKSASNSPNSKIQKNIVSGDSKFTSIAAASIFAKVSRDNLMERLENSLLLLYQQFLLGE